MYNRLYNYLISNSILYKKQFGFQSSNSTEYAIMELVDQISNSFDSNKFTLGVFIDLSKAFDTVDHNIMLEKLKHYGASGNNLAWFKSYLDRRKQFIYFDQSKTECCYVTCGVLQGSILGPLLFLLYVNDLPNTSKIINPLMFADDTNLFWSNKDIKTLFSVVNQELAKIDEWFKVNKLSLNLKKTNYIFFHQKQKKEDIPLKLPKISINENNIDRVKSTKFLGVLIDENLSWNEHIQLVVNKISKNIGILHKAKTILNKKCLTNLYFSFINSYINYGNIAWGSTYHTNLKQIHSKQKHACRIIYKENKLTHSKPLMKDMNALNVYQINIYKTLIFMYNVKAGLVPDIFKHKFKNIEHKYPTAYSHINFKIPFMKHKFSRFCISSRGPQLWNHVLDEDTKQLTSIWKYKKTLKTKLLDLENITCYF